MTKNPEFIRNLWLSDSPFVFVITAMTAGGLFLTLYVLQMTGEPEMFLARPLWEAYAFGLFALFTILFGSIRTSTDIAVEIQEHTWDGQRMSAIPPWSMAWGKLLGSTVFCWFGGIICLITYALLAPWHSSLPIADILRNTLVWILAGITAQSAAMAFLLTGLQSVTAPDRDAVQPVSGYLTWFACILIVPIYWLLLPSAHNVVWFGWQIGALDFLIFTAAVIAAWSLTGMYFAMRREFQYTNGPLPWLGFAAFTIFYAAGFEPGAGDPLMLISLGRSSLDGFVPVKIGAVLVYAIALQDNTDWRAIRRIGRACERRDWKEVFDQTPRSILTLALLAVVICGYLFAGEKPFLSTVPSQGWGTGDVLIAFLLFAARDISILLLLRISSRSKPSEFMALGYLLLVWGVLPVTVFLLAEPLLPVFWPVAAESVLLTIGPAFLQVVLITVMLCGRLRSIHLEKL